MDAICYICNERSTDFRRNFAEVKSQHTQTPIADFVNSILADFNSERNVDDASNCICTECLKRIDDYDLSCQQAIEQEAELRHLLFSTELTLRYTKKASVEIRTEIENHNERALVGGLRDLLGECDIKLEPEDDDTNAKTSMVCAQPTLSLPLPSAPLQASNPTFAASVQRNLANTPAVISTLPNGNDIRDATIKPVKSWVIPLARHTITVPIQPKPKIVAAASTTTTTAAAVPIGTHPRPTYPYPCLIALAMKNSRTGSLPVSEIYDFICAQFPYYRMTSKDWKCSVRRVLSSYFEKQESPIRKNHLKNCLWWSMNPSNIPKIDEEIQIWLEKDPFINRRAMANPDKLEAMLHGVLLYGNSNKTSDDQLNKAKEHAAPESDATNLINDLFENGAQPLAKRKRFDVNPISSNP